MPVINRIAAFSDDMTAWRRHLHQHPELGQQCQQTAAFVVERLREFGITEIHEGIAISGVVAIIEGQADGPTIGLRADMDALPISETTGADWASKTPGKMHACGHDGHTTMLLGAARYLAETRNFKGRIALIFQPAEETGFGAQAVIDDRRWPEIRPDFAFAYHNVPSRPLGEIGLRDGPANCASRGMQILLNGKSSHAAVPEDGVSPGAAMAHLMQLLPALGSGTISDTDFGLSTLTHVRLGAPTFGIAPGEGELRVTLRSMTDKRMESLISETQTIVENIDERLKFSINWHDVFSTVVNDVEATDIARQAARARGLNIYEMDHPMRWSEDFGRFGLDGVQATMMFLGAGETQPQLHNPDYDFPDALLPLGADFFLTIIDQILSEHAE
jgi:amidohydrolase